ncbi:uncharacterized protein M6B38_191070 [Iris pallida]|uniref:Uncharacterized protein n=1 Tax=Iris pallida TaxID=29817 RepID=A0AAX6EFE1_IRIPA|nr:uncharacterized protein M6B38_191070 [Iris pallida]
MNNATINTESIYKRSSILQSIIRTHDFDVFIKLNIDFIIKSRSHLETQIFLSLNNTKSLWNNQQQK